MGKLLSIDLRSRLVAAVAVRTSCLSGIAFRCLGRQCGAPGAGGQRGRHCSRPRRRAATHGRIEAVSGVILAAVAVKKDISLVELTELPCTEHWASFGASTLWRCLNRHSMAFKEMAHAAEQERPDVATRRQAWFAAQPDLDARRLVFINETGASAKMVRLRGRALKGERCRAAVPHGYRKTTTFTSALRVDGMTVSTVLDGPMNRAAFQAYVEQVLVPTLRRGDTVIMDDLPGHEGVDVRLAIEAAGAALRYLPPTSTRSRSPPPSSRRSCKRPQRARSAICGTSSEMPCHASRHRTEPTTSPQPGMSQINRICSSSLSDWRVGR